MNNLYLRLAIRSRHSLPLLLFVLSFPLICLSQQPINNQQPSNASTGVTQNKAPARRAGDLPIGPGDVLAITVGDFPEASGKYRVTAEGEIDIPTVPTPIKVAGKTPHEIAGLVAAELKANGILKQPVVSVFPDELHSRTVTVAGAVKNPGVYPLDKRTTLMDAVSLAGGLSAKAGQTATLRRAGNPGSGHDINSSEIIEIQVRALMDGKDPAGNVEVDNGDLLTVGTAPVVYVVGAVSKPGGYVLQDTSNGVTVLQALAMAEGLSEFASARHTMILRRTAEAKNRATISVNLASLMNGKSPDVPLQANDILFVPDSRGKKTAKWMARTAEQTIVGVTTYGLGLRLAY